MLQRFQPPDLGGRVLLLGGACDQPRPHGDESPVLPEQRPIRPLSLIIFEIRHLILALPAFPLNPTGAAPVSPAAPPCGDPNTPIATIQGAGPVSPQVGAIVTTEGVVVGDFQGASGLNGFYLQDRTGDGEPLTAEGIFVSEFCALAIIGIFESRHRNVRCV